MSSLLRSLLIIALTGGLVGCSRISNSLADASSIVVTISDRPSSLTITGEDARRLAQAVSSARRESMEDSCIYDIKATFLNGTNVLGEIVTCGSLFYFDGKKYHDPSGLLEKLVVTPIRQADSEWAKKKHQTGS